MGAAEVRAGKETERAVVRWLRGNGFPGADRTRRTGGRSGPREWGDEGDVGLCPGVIAQVKRCQNTSRAERNVNQWMRDTRQQTTAAGAELGLLVVRRTGTADVAEWWCFVTVADLCLLAADHTPYPGVADATVRLQMGDAALLLRAAGWGTPPLAEAV